MKKIFLIFLFSITSILAQELDATVTINAESLPAQNRDYLTFFGQAAQDYLNRVKFTGTTWEYAKIKCSFLINVTTVSDNNAYSAQVIVRSSRGIYNSTKFSPMLLVNDNSWSFMYDKNQMIVPDPNAYNDIATVLDFYASVIIALDMDSWTKLSGQPMFEKAFNLANLGASSSENKGWSSSSSSYSRKDLVENILSEKYRPFREAAYGYQYGLDQLTNSFTEKNGDKATSLRDKGMAKIIKFINVLNDLKSKIDFRSVYVRAFFDAKSGEIIEALKDYPDKSVFKTLKAADPQRLGKYDEAMKN